jgi:hypothetical protein
VADLSLAHHEAGHAVIGQVLGLRVRSAELFPDGHESSLHGVTTLERAFNGSWSALAALYLAGTWSAAMVDPSSEYARLQGPEARIVEAIPASAVDAARAWLDRLADRCDVRCDLELTALRLVAHGTITFEA